MDSELTGLANIGGVLAADLVAVGVTTPDELRRIGSREAFLRLKAAGLDPCLSRLQALEGAVRGIRWHDMDACVKEELKAFFRENG